ncbi:MAG: uncharacterized protein A8A55_0539 [Amphiamblys sp. WSBS2006]|nr:MAG: uncharacterized protein A8A55_0539 [Amphiamblys sp. WSBS2006]
MKIETAVLFVSSALATYTFTNSFGEIKQGDKIQLEWRQLKTPGEEEPDHLSLYLETLSGGRLLQELVIATDIDPQTRSYEWIVDGSINFNEDKAVKIEGFRKDEERNKFFHSRVFKIKKSEEPEDEDPQATAVQPA